MAAGPAVLGRLGVQRAGLLLAAAGYILTRSVPVPGDTGDRGNWLEPLGVAALFTEGIVIILAVLVLASIATPGRRGTSTPAGPQRRDRLGPLSR